MTDNTLYLPASDKEITLVKADKFVWASYTLSVNEARVIWACLSKIDSEDKITANTEIMLTVEEARHFFYREGNSRNVYRDLKDACARLFDREVQIRLNEDEVLLTRLVSSVQFNKKSKHVILSFAPKILPYISGMKDGYTRIVLEKTRNFSSYAAFRLYEIFESQVQKGINLVEMSLDEMRHYLQVENKYPLFAELRRRVIEPTIDQINEFTQYNVVATYQKKHNFSQYDTVIFQISLKRQTKALEKPKKIVKKPKTASQQKNIEF